MEQLITQQEYTIKDQLDIKHLGGSASTALQSLNYSYLENGFLKGINETIAAADLFPFIY